MAYQLSNIVTKVQKRVRDSAYSTTTVKEFINDTQNDLFNEYDLRFMETSQNYTLTDNNQDVTSGAGLSSNFVRAITLVITTDNYENELVYIDTNELDRIYPDQSSVPAGTPRYWTFYGNTINVFPKPDQAYVVRVRYIKRPTELSLDADIPEVPKEFEELLVYGASYRIFEEKDMDDKASIFEGKYQREVQKLLNRYSLRQTGQPMFMKLTRQTRKYRAESIFR